MKIDPQTVEIREKKFIKAKLQGKSNTAAAMIATGTKSNDVAKTQGHRLSTSVNVQSQLLKALKKHKITIDKAVRPIADALEATKVHIVGNGEQAMAEIVIDHQTRLSASDRALKLLKQTEDSTIQPDLKELADAINDNMDEVQLTHLAFKKNDTFNNN